MVYELKYGWNPSFSAGDSEFEYLSKFGQNPPTGSVGTSAGKADFYSLSRMFTLNIRSRSPSSNQIFIVSQ